MSTVLAQEAVNIRTRRCPCCGRDVPRGEIRRGTGYCLACDRAYQMRYRLSGRDRRRQQAIARRVARAREMVPLAVRAAAGDLDGRRVCWWNDAYQLARFGVVVGRRGDALLLVLDQPERRNGGGALPYVCVDVAHVGLPTPEFERDIIERQVQEIWEALA